MNEWKSSYDLIHSNLQESGILADCEEILYCVNGDYKEAQDYIKNKNIFLVNNSVSKYEFPTLNLIKDVCSREDVKILYIHTKGASTGLNQNIIDWINVMCYFNVHQYKSNLELLDEFDAIGVDYHTNPFKHFSGNFWWSKSSHINKLPHLVNEDRHAAERWICSMPGIFKSTHETKIPVFERHLHGYPLSKYR